MYRIKIPNLEVNTESLMNWFQNHINEVIYRHTHWGGFSLWSSTGAIDDGWTTVTDVQQPNYQEFIKPTPVCYGAAAELIEQLSTFNPFRIRLVVLKAKKHEYWHKNNDFQNWRITVPIQSTPGVGCEYKREKVARSYGIEPGSAYLFRQDIEHRLINIDDSDFIAIVAETLYKP